MSETTDSTEQKSLTIQAIDKAAEQTMFMVKTDRGTFRVTKTFTLDTDRTDYEVKAIGKAVADKDTRRQIIEVLMRG